MLVYSPELDGLFPEELEGIGVILARANQRAARQRPISTCSSISGQEEGALEGVVTEPMAACGPPPMHPRPHSLQPTSSPPVLPGRGRGAFARAASESEPLLTAGAPPAYPPPPPPAQAPAPPPAPPPPKRMEGITERSTDSSPSSPGRFKDQDESSV